MTASPPGRGRRLRLALLLALIPLALAVVLGCSGRKSVHKSFSPPPAELVAKPWLNVGETLPSHDGDSDTFTGLSQVLDGREPIKIPGKPLNILVMSGGGKYGAFTAGALVGWTASGTRPTFDVATGVSSGAIVATLAFLGPKYDEALTRSFTALRRQDLFRWRPLRGLCSGTGLMSAEDRKSVV